MSSRLHSSNRPFLCVVALIFFTVAIGCTKDEGSSGNGGTGSGGGNGGGGGGANGNTTLDCGIVSDGDLSYPDLGDGETVQVVSVLSNNLVVIADRTSGQNRRLVKLQGLGNSPTDFKRQGAIDRIERKTAQGAVFFKAGDCEVTLDNGGIGTIGSLLTLNGESLTEDLIKNDFAPADANDACSGSLFGACLKDLESSVDQEIRGELKTSFLWKPVSDSDGNLAVLVYECNVRVFVNGTELRFAGSGNGRCSTMRGDRPGCAYGSNAVVKVIDADTELPYTHEGSTEITIPSGCQRFEF